MQLAAHSLKGSVANFAAAAAVAAALRLEIMGHDGDLSHAGEAVAALEREIDLLIPVLHTLRATVSTKGDDEALR